MMELTLQLPDRFNLSALETKMLIAAKLYEDGRLPIGKAAEVAGISAQAFADSLKYPPGVSSPDEMTWEAFFKTEPCPEFELERNTLPPQERDLWQS